MNQFKFRLQKVQDLRARQRDTAAESLRQAQLAVSKLREEEARIMDEHARQNPSLDSLNQGRVDTQRLLEARRYQMHLIQQVQQLHSQIALVEAEVEKRRQALIQREQALRSMENLQEQQRVEWDAAAGRKAQIALDEWAGFRYWEKEAE